MRLCVLFICLCWQRLSLIVVCLLETAAGDVNLSSAEPLQLFSIHRGLCWRVALSVCAVWRNSRTSPSANRSLCLTHDRRITLAGPAVSAPVFVCVGYEKVCVCAWVSDLSAVISTQPQAHTRAVQQWSHTNQASILWRLHFLPPALTVPIFSHCIALFYPFTSTSSSVSFACPLSSRHLFPTSSPFLFSCHSPPPPCSPPSLTPQLESTMRWQWQGCGMCVRALVFVCVMSHHSSSIVALSFFNPRAHRPHCYFKIL